MSQPASTYDIEGLWRRMSDDEELELGAEMPVEMELDAWQERAEDAERRLAQAEAALEVFLSIEPRAVMQGEWFQGKIAEAQATLAGEQQ